MTTPTIVAEGASIVMIGQFNPAIVTPPWLERKGLLGPGESDEVTEQVIVPRTTVFALPSFRCEVTETRLNLQTEDPLEFSRLRDMAIGLLDSLPETPLAAVGMNRFFHFGYERREDFDALGDQFAPKALWAPILNLPGLRSMLMEGTRTDGYHGWVWIKMEPSNVHQQAVYIEHNDHVMLQRTDKPAESRSDFARLRGEVKDFGPSSERVPLARAVISDQYFESIATASRAADYLVGLLSESK